MNILIAGNSGHIGSFLYQELLSIFSSPNNNIDGINTSILDLTSYSETERYLEKISYKWDLIIFLVGLAHHKGKKKDLESFKELNYHTLTNFFNALKKDGKLPEKIIFASTISVYGEQMTINKYDESIAPKPVSPYATTKLMTEEFLTNKYVSNSWILRFSPVYSSSFLLNIKRRTKIGSWFYRIGNGEAKLSLCNINNIKSAIEGIIYEKVPPGIYNVSDSLVYTFNDLLDWQSATNILHIPKMLIDWCHYFGKIIGNNFLIENSVKLISDNVFPSDKIRSYVELPSVINDVIFDND